jgi:hypothetical protein
MSWWACRKSSFEGIAPAAKLLDADGVPVAGQNGRAPFRGRIGATLATDARGNARLEESPLGSCEVSIPDVDPNSWAVA